VIEALTQLAMRKWLIARVMGVSILIGVILCFALPDRYTAVTMIMPPKQTQSTTSFLNAQLGSLADAAGGTGGLLKDPNSIYIGLLRSRPVSDAIIGRFNLAEVYRAKDMTDARKTLKNRTEIVSEKSTLISISVIDGDKRRAAELANAYAEQLRVLSKTISFTEASQRRKFFEEQVKSQKEVLIAAELAFQQVQQSKGLIQLDAQAGVIIGSLAKLRGEIAAKEVQLQALLSYSTEHNADVQLAERELSAMRGEAAQLEQHSQPTRYSDMSLKDVPKAGLDYIRAARELHYQQALFDTLLRQYEAASLDEAKEAAVIQVVEPAIEPERRSSPKGAMIMPLAIFAGLVGGCLLARFVWWKQSIQSDPDRAMRLHGLTSALLTRQGSGA
jgi:tyrosine-protein kinase Etk/Wzc